MKWFLAIACSWKCACGMRSSDQALELEYLRDMDMINASHLALDGPRDPKVYKDALNEITLSSGLRLLSVLEQKALWDQDASVTRPPGQSGRLQLVLAGLCPLDYVCSGNHALAFVDGDSGAFYQQGNRAAKIGSSMRSLFIQDNHELKLESEPDLDVYLLYITGKATGGGMFGWTVLHGWAFLTDRVANEFFKKRIFVRVQTVPFTILGSTSFDKISVASPWPTMDDVAIPESENYKYWA
mmetsp:Transcript_106820/g.189840  ORF Transcript_106820/g.189840 Transcript_106820/m.189840 type:complete len:241 (+) Transcript_106820:66-788(+)